jgi:hypothetical protein
LKNLGRKCDLKKKNSRKRERERERESCSHLVFGVLESLQALLAACERKEEEQQLCS